MKTVVLTFVYPIAEPYYRETLASITEQTDQDFDTVVVDDKLNADDLGEDVRIIKNTENLSLVPLRQKVFNLLLEEGYDLMISIDADDTMSADRVEKTKKAYLEHSEAGFYYSDLHYMSDKGRRFFTIPQMVEELSEILSFNFVGLSHTSLNLAALRSRGIKFDFPEAVIALDWFLVSWLLQLGFSGMKTDAVTYYRLYDLNLAGETSRVTKDKVIRSIQVKLNHYKALLPLLDDNGKAEFVRSELDRLAEILQAVDDDMNDYLAKISNETTNFWWAGY